MASHSKGAASRRHAGRRLRLQYAAPCQVRRVGQFLEPDAPPPSEDLVRRVVAAASFGASAANRSCCASPALLCGFSWVD